MDMHLLMCAGSLALLICKSGKHFLDFYLIQFEGAEILCGLQIYVAPRTVVTLSPTQICEIRKIHYHE